jgi:Mg2+ and Co2+ transporter CorA
MGINIKDVETEITELGKKVLTLNQLIKKLDEVYDLILKAGEENKNINLEKVKINKIEEKNNEKFSDLNQSIELNLAEISKSLALKVGDLKKEIRSNQDELEKNIDKIDKSIKGFEKKVTSKATASNYLLVIILIINLIFLIF